jgi:release factor glutamine methyltransferase
VNDPVRSPGASSRSAETAITWRTLLAEARARLGSASEARLIVQRASGYEGSEYHACLDEAVTAGPGAHYDHMVGRRQRGEPLQYVLGAWGFRKLDLLVDRRVLIPRPETETVVEVALSELRRLERRRPLVVDLGTGSGAIALSVAAEAPATEVWGTDRSRAALAVARANLAGMGRTGTRVTLAEGSWFAALPSILRGRVDLVVSNPPYVGEREVPDLPPEVAHWEPREALVAGPTGLEQLEAIVGEARRWLARPGSVVLEIAPHQAQMALDLAYGEGFLEADVRPDLAGRIRALVARV